MKEIIKDVVWKLMELKDLGKEGGGDTFDLSIERAEKELSKATCHLRGESFHNPKYDELISKYERSWRECHSILTGGSLVRKDIIHRVRG